MPGCLRSIPIDVFFGESSYESGNSVSVKHSPSFGSQTRRQEEVKQVRCSEILADKSERLRARVESQGVVYKCTSVEDAGDVNQADVNARYKH